MTQPIIQVKYGTHESTKSEIRDVWIKSINDALLSARGDVNELSAWLDFARTLKFYAGSMLDEAKHGPQKHEKPFEGMEVL